MTGWAAAVRMTAVAAIAGMALPADAARQGTISEASRGAIEITVSVAPQAQLVSDAAGLCLWSNTATRLLTVTAEGEQPADRAEVIAAQAPGCATGGRLALAALPAGDARTILVSPE